MSMGNSWSYVSTDKYKSTNKLIHLLCDIVAKGGNFLLNVGPDADGNLPDTALLRMKEIGEWMKVNGEAIYGTHPVYPYAYGKFRFTQKGNKVYAIFLLDEQESPVPDTYWFEIPDTILWNTKVSDLSPKPGKVRVLGSKKKATLRKDADGRYRIDFPNHFEMPHAVVFEMKTYPVIPPRY